MLHELGQVVALERAFRDRGPRRLGLFRGYLVIGRSELKDQVIRVRDVPGRRCPLDDRERLQTGIESVVGQLLSRDDFLVPVRIASRTLSMRCLSPCRLMLTVPSGMLRA